MLNKLFGGKKRTSATEGRTNPSLDRHDWAKYASFCMPEQADNPLLVLHGPPKPVLFSVPEWSNDPPLDSHIPPKSTSFFVPERSDNPPLDSHCPPESASFSVPGRLNNPPIYRHGPPESASFFVPGRSENHPLGRHGPPKYASLAAVALKIIHAGGKSEYYYMATPAASIIEKYPSFILAKPDVFRKPWDSVVHKDEILIPGQKYYVIPQCTLRKLKRRIKKNNHSFISQSSQDSTYKSQRIISIIKTKTTSSDKNKARNRRVRFFGIDCNQDSSCSISLEMINKENEEEDLGKILNDPHRIIRANRNVLTWQPTLHVINEK